MAGFRKGELLKVKKEILNLIRRDKLAIQNLATTELQNAVKFYDVYDTGNLRKSSYGQVFVFDNSAIIRLVTDGESAPYWMYPRNGWGTSRNYGPRKYDILAGQNVAKKLNLK